MITEKVVNILKTLSGLDEIQPETSLKEDLALDSLNMVALLITLEDTFQVELEETDMNPFVLHTVQDVIELVEKYCCFSKQGMFVEKA